MVEISPLCLSKSLNRISSPVVCESIPNDGDVDDNRSIYHVIGTVAGLRRLACGPVHGEDPTMIKGMV